MKSDDIHIDDALKYLGAATVTIHLQQEKIDELEYCVENAKRERDRESDSCGNLRSEIDRLHKKIEELELEVAYTIEEYEKQANVKNEFMSAHAAKLRDKHRK